MVASWAAVDQELRKFSQHMRAHQAGKTADKLDMALQMARGQFEYLERLPSGMAAAYKVGGQTIIASSGPFPRDRTNCFDLILENHRSYKVVNMGLENLQYLIEKGKVDWPLMVQHVETNPRCVEVVDARVPREYLREYWCETCIGRQFIPEGKRRPEPPSDRSDSGLIIISREQLKAPDEKID